MEDSSTAQQCKVRYRAWAESCQDLPIWHQPWWLDACCGPEGWGVRLAYDAAGHIIGSLCYQIDTLYKMSISRQPAMTPWLGPWRIYPPDLIKSHARIDHQLKIDYQLLNGLPKTAYWRQAFMPEIDNYLAWYWHGHHEMTHYTYRLDLSLPLRQLWNNMSGSTRRKINKADAAVHYTEISPDRFWDLHRRTYERKGLRLSYSKEIYTRVIEALNAQGAGALVGAEDRSGECVAGGLFVWDYDRVYYLLGGSHPQIKNTQAMRGLFWHMIQHHHSERRWFDFEGSMVTAIERVYRGFGAEPMPYHVIAKTASRWVDIAYLLMKGRRLK